MATAVEIVIAILATANQKTVTRAWYDLMRNWFSLSS
jgi:hypothetical protein